MATLGRVFVLVNGFAALTFLMWSVALFTNRVNWFTDKAGNKENIGIVDKFDQRFKERNKNALLAANRWDLYTFSEPNSLAVVEREREVRRDFYRDNLARVSEGKGRDGKAINSPQLIRKLKRDASNIKLEIGPNQEYYSYGRSGLDSIAGYGRRISDVRDQLDVKQKEATQLVKQYEALTLEIFGSSNPRVLGLRDLIKEQDAVDAGAQSGTAYLIPIITEREAQTEIFLERRSTLNDRLAVLQAFIAKRQTSVQGRE